MGMSDNLTEFVDAEIFVSGADSPTDEKKLLAVLENVAGIEESKMAHGRVDVHYDPTKVTKIEISQKIEAAGYRITDVEAAASSPLTDAGLTD